MEQFEFEKQKKKKIRKEPIYIICCILCLMIGGATGIYFGKKLVKPSIQSGIYEETAQILEDKFYDLTDSDLSLEQRMLYGMSGALGDQYTSYFTNEGSKEYNQTIEGRFVGVGIQYIAVPAGGLVINVFDTSPASQAGMMKGDIITHVEGTTIEGFTSTQIQEKVLGEEGSKVSLTVLRNGEKKELDIIRGDVESSLSYKIQTMGNEKVGLITLTTFGQGTVELFENALKEFKKQNIQTICIDLRDNGGGYLESVIDLVSYFVPEGQVVMKTQDKNNKTQEYKSRDCEKYSFEKGFILMNSGSASSSEVMIGALTELLGYKTIGETSFGKGVVQDQYVLSNSSVLKVTTRKWMTPQGHWIHKQGFQPDYEVKEKNISSYVMDEMKKSYQYDSVDPQVIYMQRCLKILNYNVDRVDGYFSKETQNALKEFEKDYHLKVNGIYEKNDATLLLSATAYKVCYESEDQCLLKVKELLK